MFIIQSYFLASAGYAIITVVISALAGYAFSLLSFKGRWWLFVVVITSIVIPPQVFIVPLFYQMITLNMVDTYWGIILPQTIAPAMVFIPKRFFDQIPEELEDAARMDGASRMRVFWSIVLPLSRPIVAAVSIFVFIGAWNNFLWPFIVTNDSSLMTLPVGLQTVKSADDPRWQQRRRPGEHRPYRPVVEHQPATSLRRVAQPQAVPGGPPTSRYEPRAHVLPRQRAGDVARLR
ncbi:ABC transporter type 1, transmembrane domain MetI-like protein [Podospora conica]|nr:ABC transporter type 1, transmembrane domain MetI-like protein [Schizothecium conicum]